MEIIEKYQLLRDKIETGDIILFESNLPLGRVIKYCDKAKYSHATLAQWVTVGTKQRLMLCEESFFGADLVLASNKIHKYVDFDVIKVNKDQNLKNQAMNWVVNKAEKGVDYGYSSGEKELLRRFAVNRLHIPIKPKKYKDDGLICSSWVQVYCEALYLREYTFIPEIFPQDYVRYMDSQNCQKLSTLEP